MARNYLGKNKLPITDENIGIILAHIYKAEWVYKSDIGSLHPFIYMYVDYALKTIRKKHKHDKKKREIHLSEIEENIGFSFEDTHKVSRHEEILELIISKNILTKLEYDVIYKNMVQQDKIKEIAEAYNVSKQYIHEVKKRAIGKLQCLKSELF